MSDDQQAIAAPVPTPALAGGDDLAAKALAASNDPQLAAGQATPALSATSDDGDEVENSNEIAETITSLQSLIERHANQLDELKRKMKDVREELQAILGNDETLQIAQDKAAEFATEAKARKSQLQADPTFTAHKVKYAELTEQKKELEEALSNHLVNWFQLTNSKSFDTSDGDQREFVIRASVKSRSKQ